MDRKTHSMKEAHHNKTLSIIGSVFLSLASLSFLTGCPNPLQDSSQKTDQSIDTSAITAAGYIYAGKGYPFKGEDCYLVMKDNNYYFWSPSLKQVVSAGFVSVEKLKGVGFDALTFKGESCYKVKIEQKIYLLSAVSGDIVSVGYDEIKEIINAGDSTYKTYTFKGENCLKVKANAQEFLLSTVTGEIVAGGVDAIFDFMGVYKGNPAYFIYVKNGISIEMKYFLSAVTGEVSATFTKIYPSEKNFKNQDCYLVQQADGKIYFFSSITGEIISDGYIMTDEPYGVDTALFNGIYCYLVRLTDLKYCFILPSTGGIVSTEFDQIFHENNGIHLGKFNFRNEECYKIKKDDKWYFLSIPTGLLSDGFDVISDTAYSYNSKQYYSVKKDGISYLLDLGTGTIIDNATFLAQSIDAYLPGFLAAENFSERIAIFQNLIDTYAELIEQNPDSLKDFQVPVGNGDLIYQLSNKYVSYMSYKNRPVYLPKIYVKAANGLDSTNVTQVEKMIQFSVNGVQYLKVTGYYDSHMNSWYEGDYYINTDTGKVIAVANASDGVRLVQGKLVVEAEFDEFWWTGSHGSTYYDLSTGELLPASQYQADYQAATSVVIEEGSSVTF